MSQNFWPFFKSRSSHRRCSVRKSVLRNFAKFTGKHLCQSLFFNKVVGLRSGTRDSGKRDSGQVFSCEFYEISKNNFFNFLTTASVNSTKITFHDLSKIFVLLAMQFLRSCLQYFVLQCLTFEEDKNNKKRGNISFFHVLTHFRLFYFYTP